MHGFIVQAWIEPVQAPHGFDGVPTSHDHKPSLNVGSGSKLPKELSDPFAREERGSSELEDRANAT